MIVSCWVDLKVGIIDGMDGHLATGGSGSMGDEIGTRSIPVELVWDYGMKWWRFCLEAHTASQSDETRVGSNRLGGEVANDG